MSETQYASLLPTDADQSGFLDGVTATIISARATTFDYNGTLAAPVPAIAVTYRNNENGKDTVQNYTVGKPEHRVPSEDGARFMVFGGKKALPKDSNGLLWLTSLINAGFPADKITDFLPVFNNAVVLLRSEALPKTEGQTKDRSVVLVDKIVTLPWDNKNPVKAAAAAGTKAAAPKTPAAKPATAVAAPVNDEAASAAAIEALGKIFTDAKYASGIAKKDAGTAAFKHLNNNPNRNAAVKLLSIGLTAFIGDGQMVQVGEKVGMATISGDNIVWGE